MRPFTMHRDRLIEELKNTLILQKLTVRELKRFAAICELREYFEGERLVEQDSVGTDLHLLLEGAVDIRLRGREGGEVLVSSVQKGDVLGEASIFMDLPRTASAVAKTSCVVAAVPRDALFGFCEANAKAGLKIFTFVIYSLLRRLGSTTRDLAEEREAVVTRDDIERLSAFFPKSLEDMLDRR